MPDFTVRKRGADPSGRDVWATDYMWSWWLDVCSDLGFTPTVVQGAFMVRSGGGADASAGYHDAGGCFDLRTWDMSEDQSERLVRVLRRHGAAAWRRDNRHGMDPHLHFVLGTDVPLAPGAASQWLDYVHGHDGLAGRGPDYEWRPAPLVLTPPEDDMPKYREWDSEDRKALANDVAEAVLDAAKVDREKKVSVRQALNQIRNAVKK